MFCVIDREKNFTPVKSGFKTASQANNWAKKNLPKDEGSFINRGECERIDEEFCDTHFPKVPTVKLRTETPPVICGSISRKIKPEDIPRALLG